MLIGKTYSQDANINKVMKHVGILGNEKPIRDYIVLHAQNPEGADIYIEKMSKLTGKLPVSVVDISPVIGMNAGVGAIAVSLMLE
jgi:fatty acid-binding protein DegV